MDGEIILEQEAAVADISHLADKSELLAYRVNGNASEFLYRIDKCFSLIFGRKHYCRADICALVFGSTGVAVRAADNGIFKSAGSVLIISHGLIAVLLKISLAAEHFKGIENLIFDEPVVERVGHMERFARYPCRMREYSESACFSYLVIQPFEHRRRHCVDIVGNFYLLGECGHLRGELLLSHDIGTVVSYRADFFILADFFDRHILDKRIDAVFAAEIYCMRVDSEPVYRGKMHLFAGHEIELGRNILEGFDCSERRIITAMVGYREEIIAIRTVSCGNILGIVRTVGEVRVHMQIADKRIHSDEITGDGIDTEREAFLIAVGVFAFDTDMIFALMWECYRNIKSVFFVCGHIEFFSESGRRGMFDMSAVEPCYRCLMHAACGKKVVAAEGADMYSALLFGLDDLREHIVSPKFASSDKICHLILSFTKKIYQFMIA